MGQTLASPKVSRVGSTNLQARARELYDVLTRLGRTWLFQDRDCICCYDVSVTQCHALRLLLERGPSTVNQLAAGLYLEKSTASRVLDSLERKGYVRRREHPEDGRAILVEVTDSGRKLLGKIEKDLLFRHAQILAEFPPEVAEAAVRLLEKLCEAAERRIDTSGGKCCLID
ncbi:putative HTH-type transcriptional regulator [bacterium HR33]|nr:putative HTH-type transcriptional regulator [bacterium HR33]